MGKKIKKKPQMQTKAAKAAPATKKKDAGFYKTKIKPMMPVLKFAGIFLLIVGSYYIFITSELKSSMTGYLSFTAKISSFLMNLIGAETTVNGQVINSPDASITIGLGCDGLDPVVIFFAAVIATPVKWLYKIAGIIIGSLIIYFANFIRIIGLYYIRINLPESFDSMHFEIFPVVFIILSIVLYGLWQNFVLKKKKEAPANA